MANVDAPFGAIPCSVNGGAYEGAINRYYADVADALYQGDIVSLSGTCHSDAFSTPKVIACTPSLIPVGIIVGFESNKDIQPSQLYKKSGDAVYVLVADDPNLRFKIQCGNGTLAITDIGLNGDLVFTEGSTATGRSKMELDHSTLATSAALHMHIERIDPQPGNAIGANANVICSWKQHARATGQVGV